MEVCLPFSPWCCTPPPPLPHCLYQWTGILTGADCIWNSSRYLSGCDWQPLHFFPTQLGGFVSVCFRFDSFSTLAPRRVHLSTYGPRFCCGRMWKSKKKRRKRGKEPQRAEEQGGGWNVWAHLTCDLGLDSKGAAETWHSWVTKHTHLGDKNQSVPRKQRTLWDNFEVTLCWVTMS